MRISIPTTYGHYRILPLLSRFRERHPGVKIDIHLSNRNIDFVGEGYDLAIRVRAQPDSTLIARHLEDAPLVVIATPQYLARVGTPTSLEDLERHDCIQFELPSSGRRISWLFTENGKERATLAAPNSDLLMWFCFSPDGAWFAASARDSVIQLFDLRRIRGELHQIDLDWGLPRPAPARMGEGPLRVDIVPATGVAAPQVK